MSSILFECLRVTPLLYQRKRERDGNREREREEWKREGDGEGREGAKLRFFCCWEYLVIIQFSQASFFIWPNSVCFHLYNMLHSQKCLAEMRYGYWSALMAFYSWCTRQTAFFKWTGNLREKRLNKRVYSELTALRYQRLRNFFGSAFRLRMV